MEPQVPLVFDSHLQPVDNATNDENSPVVSDSINLAMPQQPVRKQTRQWAAWTLHEEGLFFRALRQVGKDFDKITDRVQSKNKNQVRHYYYRLVRRMNKLLAPGFVLDPKNSKDTNAAMLRWWSVLEKYSCKASKLHMKPKKFKAFLETVGDQLLKDQKKNKGKKSSTVESFLTKTERRRRKMGASIVSDAAEHLEPASTEIDVDNVLGHKGIDPAEDAVVSHAPNLPENIIVKRMIHEPIKLKLQLFPIDRSTQNELEMKKYNPILELTVPTRKKISSILQHLKRKWSNLNIAPGELMLFPYKVQRDGLVNSPRWTQNDFATASEVHTIIGSPPIFRLRYGWISDIDITPVTAKAPSFTSAESNVDMYQAKAPTLNSTPLFTSHHTNGVSSVNERYDIPNSNPIVNEMAGPSVTISNYESPDSGNPFENIPAQKGEGLLKISSTPSAEEWLNSLTVKEDPSVGDLLSEASREMNAVYVDPRPFGYEDSFDAAIATLKAKLKNGSHGYSSIPSQQSPLLDAEQTCDVFSYPKNGALLPEASDSSKITSLEISHQVPRTASLATPPEVLGEGGDRGFELVMNEEHTGMFHSSIGNDGIPLSDVFWSDSMGLLDIGGFDFRDNAIASSIDDSEPRRLQ